MAAGRNRKRRSNVITACSLALAYVGGALTVASFSVLDWMKDEQVALTKSPTIMLDDPIVQGFTADKAFSGPEWKALTVINGWDRKRDENEQWTRLVAANTFVPAFKAEADRVAADAANRALPTSEERPVYEAVLRTAQRACTAGIKTPAEYIAGLDRSTAARDLEFNPRNLDQQYVALRAYQAAVAAGVKHLCPAAANTPGTVSVASAHMSQDKP